MVLLQKEINLIYCFLFFVFTSCSYPDEKNNKTENKTEIISSKEINKYVESNFYSYETVYKLLNDSVIFFVSTELKSFVSEILYPWQIDSFVVINSMQNKLVTVINSSTGKCHDCSMDQVTGLLGKKINGKWYFFKGGGTLAVPRDMFGKDAMHPLSFYELSQIARKNYLSGAIIKNNKGQLIVNDKWVDSYFEGHGVCAHCKTKAQYDSTHWFYIMDKWKHKIDTNEYKPLRRKQHKKVNV